MRIIEAALITEAVAKLCIEANIVINDSLRNALINAGEKETLTLPCHALDTIIKNAEIAKKERLPICQDTGMAVVFVHIGVGAHVNGDISEAIHEGVRKGYREGYLRNSVVGDPVNRVNTGDNTPAVIHYDFTAGEQIHITVAPKGFGSENMSGIRMLNPSDGIEGAEDFILETVSKGGANPCPPIIVGVGIGGTMEKAALIAKQALLRDLGSVNRDPFWAEAEIRLLGRINELGIGASGYGGKSTALGVHINTYPTHIAGLPVAVNIGCHATRHSSIRI
ncbi:MAG: fumarate hydratase [Oscillospiraceae bacterium]|nr:fumarate hydratase [Oscillospiraceae bacterium]